MSVSTKAVPSGLIVTRAFASPTLWTRAALAIPSRSTIRHRAAGEGARACVPAERLRTFAQAFGQLVRGERRLPPGPSPVCCAGAVRPDRSRPVRRGYPSRPRASACPPLRQAATHRSGGHAMDARDLRASACGSRPRTGNARIAAPVRRSFRRAGWKPAPRGRNRQAALASAASCSRCVVSERRMMHAVDLLARHHHAHRGAFKAASRRSPRRPFLRSSPQLRSEPATDETRVIRTWSSSMSSASASSEIL